MLPYVCAFVLAQTSASDVLFGGARLNCRDWSEVANYYIGMGEDQACADLLQNAQKHKHRGSVRAALICRVLFQSKGHGALRAPKYGDLSLPPMPLSAWPEFPLAQEDGVWFEFDENYMDLESKAEPFPNYLDYCRKNGTFRKDRLPVPTHQEAADALSALMGSKRWTSIHWSDGDLHSSYTYHRDWTIEILKSETKFSDD